MTKLSFINNNPDDRRITIRTASKESKITPLAEFKIVILFVLNELVFV